LLPLGGQRSGGSCKRGGTQMSMIEVRVPDIGDFKDVPIIEVFVKPGDTVKAEDSLITLESDKATMDVPSPAAGTVRELKVKVGDKVAEGVPILTLDAADAGAGQPAPAMEAAKPAPPTEAAKPAPAGPSEVTTAAAPAASAPSPGTPVDSDALKAAHASPSVRKFARELAVDIARVTGTGPKGRILQEDVQKFVKQVLTAGAAGGAVTGGGALNLLPWPQVDFAKFGAVESRPLSRIKKISGANLARNWVMIPHVTQFDEADVTDLEALRHELGEAHARDGVRITMLAFVLKALVRALTEYPEFNSSLDGDNLIPRKYFHFGFAADTPEGLVVPVVRDVDKKGVLQIARDTAALAQAAREGKLKMTDIQGGCFTVSSLGGIGGTAFTPIINAPEVAILGLSRLATKPLWHDGAFVPRLILPLSLAYDHRVIDGALAARFVTYLSAILGDMRRALL
jgi:pyruvate dehydrogenase E2 component (dihydrolipoamide acetyltransferase)